MLSYLYQLQNANYNSLSSTDFKIAVIDPDDAGLTNANVAALENTGKTLFSYLSIGEAEDYRSYWINNNWNSQKPDFLLAENPNWPGNYNVKFWDSDWQAIILNRVTEMAKAGYSGAYLDIVDAYQVPAVQQAYDGASGNIRQDMVNFVIKISQAAKAVNPDFKIIPQNGIELLSVNDDPTVPNTTYLKAIDGVGKEDTWTDDNQAVDWTKWDLEYLHLATNAGKFVLAVDYPTDDALQAAFIQKAIGEGFIPFVGTRALDGTIDAANYTIPSQLPVSLLDAVTGSHTVSEPVVQGIALIGTDNADVISGTDGADVLWGKNGNDQISGKQGNDSINGNQGLDTLRGGKGEDTLHGGQGNDAIWGDKGNDYLFGDKGNDTLQGGEGRDIFVCSTFAGKDVIQDFHLGEDILQISGQIYSSVSQVLQHISYSTGHAVVDLGSNNTIEIVSISGGLTAQDFEIG